MKKHILLVFWLVFVALSLSAREKVLVEGRNDSTFLKSFLKKGDLLQSIDVNAQLGTMIANDFECFDHVRTNFRENIVRLEILGDINPQVGFHFRVNFNDHSNPSTSLDKLNSSVSLACVTWAPFKKTSFTIGKQFIRLGGHEFDAKVTSVPVYSNLGEALPCYAVGLNIKQMLNQGNSLSFQITNSHEKPDKELFYKGLPKGVETAVVPLRLSLYWEGKFLDESLIFHYSVSGAEIAKNKKQFSLFAGNTWKRGPILAYIDVMYEKEEIDYIGYVSKLQMYSGRSCTAQNVDYLTFIADFDLWLSKHWKVFLKGAYEFGNVYKSSGTLRENNLFPSGNYIKTWMGEACVEYYPIKNYTDFRIYLTFTHKQYMMSDIVRKLGVDDYSTQLLGLGFVYTVPVL